MPMPTKEFLGHLAEAMAIEPDQLTETATFDEVGGMDSLSRLNLLSMLETNFGSAAIFDGLKSVEDVPTLLTALRTRGLIE